MLFEFIPLKIIVCLTGFLSDKYMGEFLKKKHETFLLAPYYTLLDLCVK